jgi:putative transcriptional regulator
MSDKIKLNRLKEILAREDRTTTWLAERIGKSRVVVSNYVNNNTQPSIETLFAIAAAFQDEGISIQPREFVAEGDAKNKKHFKKSSK